MGRQPVREEDNGAVDDVGTQILIFFALDPKLVPKPEV
jgi:hypothetical protein